MKTVNLYDYLVIGGYFLFMLAIGLYFTRINKSGKEYFAGGNMIPWWVSGMTLFMANFSAWTFTASAGFAYTDGLFVLLYFSTGWVAYVIGTTMTAARWRRTRSISPVEYTYTRYNVTTQQFLSWVIGINFTLSAGVQLASTCKLMAPVIQLDMTTLTIITGIVVLSYTFFGGVWAVSITDAVQGIILLCTCFILVPLCLGLVGGLDGLLAKLPPLTMDHTYNGVHYDEWWLLSILLISSIGFAGGSGQRFYSVKDEASARKVGYFAAALGILGPIMFGIPPLVAKVLWPDLMQVDFFKPYAGNNPQDLVYIGLAMQLLPNGLIGAFVAAMLAATMSTLSSVYNMVSSIFARDMYQGLFRPQTRDDELLKVGRIASISIGVIVTLLAIVFVNSKWGIFNIMVAFFTLFNIPVTVPLAFGLLFRRVPKWSAVAGISWGLIAGAAGRWLLGWDIGPQVFFSFVMTFGIFATSRWTSGLYERNKPMLLAVATLVTVAVGLLVTLFLRPEVSPLLSLVDAADRVRLGLALGWTAAVLYGISLYPFARLFALETDEQRAQVRKFFEKLDTPVDVQKEVFGSGKKQVSVFPLVGITLIIMAALLSLVFLTDLQGSEVVVGTMIGLFFVIGSALWYFGKRSEIRGAGGVP
jgi:SSS family transporter